MLEIKDIVKIYGNRWSAPALDITNLVFSPGEIVGLFGENGAGKTTLFNCILKYTPYWGDIALDGEAITYRNIARIAYGSSDNTFFSQLTVLEHKDFYAMSFPSFNASRFGLLVDFFELPVKKQVKNLSQGQKNQVETILALSQGATYILLDEPFANNDIFNREDFYKVLLGLLQPEECLILASHLIHELTNFVSRIVLLRKGKLLADKTIEELDQEELELVPWMKQLYSYENRAAKFIEKTERDSDEE
jgi:ABC-2 type transport system ATP-binding protein